jgi:hypothetical protein
MMLALEKILPGITKFKSMKILGSGQSITKYSVADIYDDTSFYVVLNHCDALRGLDEIIDAPILFFAHDYHAEHFNSVIEKNITKYCLNQNNVHVFLHNKNINHRNIVEDINYPPDRLSCIKNLHYYERSQSNLRYFESTANSLIGFSSTLHSPLSFPIGNDFIEEVQLYGMDMYIYQRGMRFDGSGIGDHANIIFNANRVLLNYLYDKRPTLKIAFFN